MDDELADVYNELIMEHSMNSYNKKELKDADYSEIGHNPNCGDEIKLELKLNGNKIEDMAFSGHGCAISQASTSIMIDTLKGKTVEEAKEIIKTFIEMIKREITDEEELKKQAKAAWFWSKLLILRHVAFPVLPYKGVKAKITHIATAIIHAGLVVFRISHNWIAGKCLKIASRYNDVDTKRMAFLFDTDPYYHIMLKDEIYPLQMYDFEDIKMPLPANEDEKLRNMYGDYMKLPPEDQRTTHKINAYWVK